MGRLAGLLILLAFPAQAHGTLPGGGGFYSGAAHPVVALEHLLALLAVGLVLGRSQQRRPIWALGLGLGAGLWAGPMAAALQVLVLPGVTFGIAALLALQWRVSEWVSGAAVLVVGFAVGADTDLPLLTPQTAALGVGVAVFLITMNAFALASALADSRAAIVLRVAGAWILAVALMVLALHLREVR